MAHVESAFQSRFIRKLRRLYPGCIILKNDPNYLQGIPDLIMLWHDRWAVFECKASESSRVQPNQAFYVEQMSEMSFGAFVYPENEKDVIHELQRAFGSHRAARIPQR
jgi:hypothetical protein